MIKGKRNKDRDDEIVIKSVRVRKENNDKINKNNSNKGKGE